MTGQQREIRVHVWHPRKGDVLASRPHVGIQRTPSRIYDRVIHAWLDLLGWRFSVTMWTFKPRSTTDCPHKVKP